VKVYLLLILAVSLIVSGCIRGSGERVEFTPPPPKPAPVLTLSDVNATVNSTTTIITWITDKPSDSLVRYGTRSGKYNMSEGSRDYVTSHNVTLTGLLPGETYYYKVGSVDPNGVASQSKEYSFTTIPLPPPLILDISTSPSADSAVIEWTTVILSESQVENVSFGNYTMSEVSIDNVTTNLTLTGALPVSVSYSPINTSCIVRYDTSPGNYTMSEESGDYATSHDVTLTGLLPGSTYYYRISCTDPNGVSNQSEEHEFKTRPAKLREMITTGDLQIMLKDFGYYSVKRGEITYYYSRAEISIKNTGDEKIPLSITSTAIVDNIGYQSDRVSVGAEDEFRPTELFPEGTITKALYYEKIRGSSGTLYMSINSKPYQFHVT
jgi:chitodextrinase